MKTGKVIGDMHCKSLYLFGENGTYTVIWHAEIFGIAVVSLKKDILKEEYGHVW